MPIFEYHCNQCNAEFERLVFASDETDIQCPKCQSNKVNKKMSAASVASGTKCSTGESGGGGGSPFS